MKKICPSCEGRGWVTESGENWIQSRTCEKCNGAGLAEVSEEWRKRIEFAEKNVYAAIEKGDDAGVLYWSGFCGGVYHAIHKEGLG